MNLLVVILNQTEHLEELLEAFIEHEVPGATIVDSVGMGSVLKRDIPIFAGFRSIFESSRPDGKLLFSLIDSESKVEETLAMVDRVMNVPGKPLGAFCFAVPVSQVMRGGKK